MGEKKNFVFCRITILVLISYLGKFSTSGQNVSTKGSSKEISAFYNMSIASSTISHIVSNTTPSSTKTKNNNITTENKINTPKSTTHYGREHVIFEKKTHVFNPKPNVSFENLNDKNGTNSSIASKLNETFPVIEKNDKGSIKPRKGAPVEPNKSHIVNNTTSIHNKIPTKKPKKPLITEPGDSNDKDNITMPDVTKLQLLTESKQHSSANYVIPIVGVILSVPIVAILISILYKRGSDWWQHRHYRRMDFLIEGMYNN